MILAELLAGVGPCRVYGQAEVEVSGLAFDSRRVETGGLFVAVPGKVTDGHRYIPQALEHGAAVIVGERDPGSVSSGPATYVQVRSSRLALAHLAAAWYGHPGRKMTVVGVTGTDGKTTTVNLLRSILGAAGRKVGMVSTVNAVIGDRTLDTGLHVTTPDALTMQSFLAEMAAAGTEIAVLEATSHGLAQHRVTAVEFDVAVVTNVTHEHLDEHGSWEQYCEDKARLFRALSTSARKPGVPKVAVINADDASYGLLRDIPADRRLRYSLGAADVEVTASDLHVGAGGTRFIVHAPGDQFEVRTPWTERYNVYNILAAAAAALGLGVSPAAIQEGAANVRGIVGRMERIQEGQEFAAIVDFAHTPNALEQALLALREQTEGRLIVVFGSAGLRDVYKREMMGRVAGRLADVTVITAEDPRTEDLDQIMEAIAAGCRASGAVEGLDFYRVRDRGEAISFAVRLAGPEDTVVAAGKGHERSMCFGRTEYPWSDRQAMRAALLERLGRGGEVTAPWLPTTPEESGAG